MTKPKKTARLERPTRGGSYVRNRKNGSLNRREEPDALHPIDRDPVPERYAESVRKYYEALGSDSGKPVK